MRHGKMQRKRKEKNKETEGRVNKNTNDLPLKLFFRLPKTLPLYFSSRFLSCSMARISRQNTIIVAWIGRSVGRLKMISICTHTNETTSRKNMNQSDK